MDKKTTDVVGYIGVIGLIIAFAAGTREQSKFHLNQSLVLVIATLILSIISGIAGGIAGVVPILGLILTLVTSICSIACFVFMILGIINAAKGVEKPLPVIGGIQILK